ncbi:AbrB/MazE/SpoVT family DNA-binding domain-containing protein [Candidatus Azambacteria bacterium]|nr:AbrB/MazE/SpoVT family DNA-binding domain-containing protein [Candidatus Azambacteria bacterium]
MPQTIISSKNQITLPKSLLEELGLKHGSRLMIRSEDNQIILIQRPKSLTAYYKGSGKSAFEKLGGGDKFLKEERKSWN